MNLSFDTGVLQSWRKAVVQACTFIWLIHYVYVHLCAYMQLCAYTQPENKTDVKQRCKSIEEVALDACLRKFAQHHWFQTLFENVQLYFAQQCLSVLLEADKAKIKGHLLNEIRFSETVPRIPIVVSQPSVFQLSVFFFWEMKQYLWGGENAFVFSFYFPI